MTSLVFAILVGVAGSAILVGLALTFRQSRHTVSLAPPYSALQLQPVAPTVQCFYCQRFTIAYRGVTHDGSTYDPVCLDCQYRTGILQPDGALSPDFFYQVQRTPEEENVYAS